MYIIMIYRFVVFMIYENYDLLWFMLAKKKLKNTIKIEKKSKDPNALYVKIITLSCCFED